MHLPKDEYRELLIILQFNTLPTVIYNQVPLVYLIQLFHQDYTRTTF